VPTVAVGRRIARKVNQLRPTRDAGAEKEMRREARQITGRQGIRIKTGFSDAFGEGIGGNILFMDHAFERWPPEFLKDWRFLFVGVRWWAKMARKA
jgi:hypothetical protein